LLSKLAAHGLARLKLSTLNKNRWDRMNNCNLIQRAAQAASSRTRAAIVLLALTLATMPTAHAAAPATPLDDRVVVWNMLEYGIDEAVAEIEADPALRPFRELIIDRCGLHSVNPRIVPLLVSLNRTLDGVDLADTERIKFRLDALIAAIANVFDMGRAQASGTHLHASLLPLSSAAGLSAIAQTLIGGDSPLARLTDAYVLRFGTVSGSPQSVAVAPAAAPSDFLRLPWLVGQKGWRFGGVHTSNGGCQSTAPCASPRSSLDFSHIESGGWGSDTSAGRVLAAHSGTVARDPMTATPCQVRVNHTSGWSTTYYHLSNVQVANGATVYAGQFIANYANTEAQAICNGGFSSGPHVHFTLLFNGNRVNMDQNELSGWKVNAANVIKDYDTDCSRMNLTRGGATACPFSFPAAAWDMHTLPSTMASNGSCAFDIDGNGSVSAATDGVLLLRYLLGLRGVALTSGAVGAGATRATADLLEPFIASKDYDMNVDGAKAAFTDGLMVNRLMRGMTGDAVAFGTSASTGLLATGSQITAFAQGCR
jgi:murein DD-endopeptidase MepM/ murein hydrolase activator NlpD